MTDKKTKQSRRTFLYKTASRLPAFLITTATICHSTFSNQERLNTSLTTVRIADNPALANPGGFVLVKNTPAGNILIVNSGNAQYTALSDVCPHKQCRVEVKSPTLIKCPCHGSAYKIDGTYVNGPSHKSLHKFRVAVESDVINVTEN